MIVCKLHSIATDFVCKQLILSLDYNIMISSVQRNDFIDQWFCLYTVLFTLEFHRKHQLFHRHGIGSYVARLETSSFYQCSTRLCT